MAPRAAGTAVVACWLTLGCAARLDPMGTPPATPATEVSPDATGAARPGLVRLTRAELDNTLRDLFGDTSRPAYRLLPYEAGAPFDNDVGRQSASAALVEGLARLSTEVAARLLRDPDRRRALFGCVPRGADDVDCLRRCVSSLGRRMFRRPLESWETDMFVASGRAVARAANDFDAGLEVVLRGLLQSPWFLFRVETGTPAPGHPGLVRLGPFEVATRLAYFVWGSGPSDELLDRAAGGRLSTPDEVRAAADRLLDDRRAVDQLDRFHALWLGYSELPHTGPLTEAMRKETASLIGRVFERRGSWLDLFRAHETYVNPLLAKHYDLEAHGTGEAFAWVTYGTSGRQGLLSHGSFLSVAGSFADTSPTQRGKLVRTRLLCETIPPPPPGVKSDQPPSDPDAGPCKRDRYEEHRLSGVCNKCHRFMDPIGFGLENYDHKARFRKTDIGLPQCPISGEGELAGVGKFRGPAELSDLLLAQDRLGPCVARQIYRFAFGHAQGDADGVAFGDYLARWRSSGYAIREMVLALVASPAFLYRREP